MASGSDAVRARSPRPPRSTTILGVVLALLLSLETWQILVEGRDFAPNVPSARGEVIRRVYWPDVPLRDEGDPLGDWVGLAAWLPQADLDTEQTQELTGLVETARGAAEETLRSYTALLEPLTLEQRRKVLEPQKGVVDHRALGLDSSPSDMIFLFIDRLDRLAGRSQPSDALPPPPDPVRLPLTRLGAAIGQLVDDPETPLTPGQARAVLDRLQELKKHATVLHRSREKALEALQADQVAGARGLPLRRAEPFPSPVTLEMMLEELGGRP